MLPGSQLNFILRYKGRYDWEGWDDDDNAFDLKVEGALEVLVDGTPAEAEGDVWLHSVMETDSWPDYGEGEGMWEEWTSVSVSISTDPEADGLVPVTLTLSPQNTTDGGSDVITHGGFVDLLPVELAWEKIDGDYPDLEDNINPFTDEVQGQRIFPGKKTPSDSRRNKVTLKVDVGIPNAQVYVKAFDVDDPTPTNDDEKENGTYLIDPNDSSTEGVGDDNRADHVIPSGKEAGFFTSSNTATANKQSDAEGIAEFEFNVGMQPGNNYRVVASVFNEDIYADIQVTDPSVNGYLGPDEDDTPTPASPLLTVWRKLHIENDSLGAVPSQRPEPDRIVKTSQNWIAIDSPPGKSKLLIDGTLPEESDFYQWGFLKKGTDKLNAFANTDNLISDDEITITHPSGSPPSNLNNFASTEIEILDDDLKNLELLPATTRGYLTLPNNSLVDQWFKERYKVAYIEVIDTSAMPIGGQSVDNNSEKIIPFTNNDTPGLTFGGIFSTDLDDKKESGYSDSSDFWYFLLVAAHQPEDDSSQDVWDGDPGAEGAPLEGVTASDVFGTPRISVVYLESIRDSEVFMNVNDPDTQLQGWSDMINRLNLRVFQVAAHEVGHAPGEKTGEEEHNENGLMSDGALGTDFTPSTITRFRQAERWTD